MRKFQRFFSALTLIIAVAQFTPCVYAEEGESAGYSVAKITPDVPQVNESSVFYDLLVKPGEDFTIQAELNNHGSENVTVGMSAFTTYTNDNGEINYSAALPEENQDESLEIAFTEIAELKEDNPVTLRAGEKKLVSMTISVPKEAADGVILGSWYFERETETKERQEPSSGITIENRFAYAMAVKLTVQQEIETPNLNLLSAAPGLNNYRKVINANVQNDQPAIVSDLDFEGRITKKGSDRTLYSGNLTNRQMAPNSNFNVPFFLEQAQLAPGDYTLHLTAVTKDEKWAEKTWEWTEDFTITREEAQKLNKEAINDPEPEPESNLVIYVLIAIIAILAVFLFIVLMRRKKERKK